MLIQEFHSLLERGWRSAFPGTRSQKRAIQHAIALPCVFGRRTISRTLGALGRWDQDWSADYKMFSRCRWKPERLFDPVIDEYLERYPKRPVIAAIDDTKLRKVGRKIKGASWHRDPLSPPFHMNFMYGLRFLQASLLFAHHQEGDYPPRGIPVRFQEAPPIKKPGKRASPEQLEQYKKLKKEKNLSTQALDVVRDLRASLDQRGGAARWLLMVGDGSFANRTMFKADLDRTHLLARCRKDARLCFRAPEGGRRKYAEQLFTPDEVRTQEDRPWTARAGLPRRQAAHGEIQRGERRVVETRSGDQASAADRDRAGALQVVQELATRTIASPAYFLTTDLRTSIKLLVQACFDRWQIEVNHRDEKDILGVGQAQVRSEQSIPRHPALAVASYSLLLLAALKSFGPGRTDDYLRTA